ncbi:amidase [Rhizobium sp. A37_96]
MRAKKVSAREIVELAIRRAELLSTSINCIAIPLYEEAREQADLADLALARGDITGPLHGIPLTVKDGIATACHPLTSGSASMVETTAAQDDLVWTRLKEAGAILLGKSTAPEFFHQVTTTSPLYGTTRNPWSPSHTPGGSSGGAAAALAAGIGPLALGSDGGGSLRCPASCTAILALKPTAGRVPHEHFPDSFGNYASFGPMARDVSDLHLMLSVMAGGSDHDAASVGRPAYPDTAMPAVEPLRLRIGWIPHPGGYRTDNAILDLSVRALETLENAGAALIEAFPADLLDNAYDAYRVIGAVGHAGRWSQQSEGARSKWSSSFAALVELGRSFTASDLAEAQAKRTILFRKVQTAFRSVDVIATPTLTGPPKAAEAGCSVDSEDYAAWAAGLYPFNLTGHPAISVPCGFTDDGLPVGIQFVAPWYEERRLLAVAQALETANTDRRRPLL